MPDITEMESKRSNLDIIGEEIGKSDLEGTLQELKDELESFYQEEYQAFKIKHETEAPSVDVTGNENIKTFLRAKYEKIDLDTLKDPEAKPEASKFEKNIETKEKEVATRKQKILMSAMKLVRNWSKFLDDQKEDIEKLEQELKDEKNKIQTEYDEKIQQIAKDTTALQNEIAMTPGGPTPEQNARLDALLDASGQAVTERDTARNELRSKNTVLEELNTKLKEYQQKFVDQIEKFNEVFKKDIEKAGYTDFKEMTNHFNQRRKERIDRNSDDNEKKFDNTDEDLKKEPSSDTKNENKDEKGEEKKKEAPKTPQQNVSQPSVPVGNAGAVAEQPVADGTTEDPSQTKEEEEYQPFVSNEDFIEWMKTSSPDHISDKLRTGGFKDMYDRIVKGNFNMVQRKILRDQLKYIPAQEPEEAQFRVAMNQIFGAGNPYGDLYSVIPEIRNGFKDVGEKDLVRIESMMRNFKEKLNADQLDKKTIAQFDSIMGDTLTQGVLLQQLKENAGIRKVGNFFKRKGKDQDRTRNTICSNIATFLRSKGDHTYQNTLREQGNSKLIRELSGKVNHDVPMADVAKVSGSIDHEIIDRKASNDKTR